MNQLTILLALGSAVLLTGCPSVPPGGSGNEAYVSQTSTLLPDYEVLPVPKGTDFYPVGTSWKAGLGPDGPPRGTTVSAPGLSSIGNESKRNLETNLNVGVKNFLSSQLNLTPSRITSIKIEDLTHRRVQSLRDTSTRGLVLWETIEGSRIAFRTDSGIRGGATANLTNSPIKEITKAGLQVSGDWTNGYHATANRPLVFAIRVVNVDYEVRQATVPITQSGATSELGYVLTQLGPEDVANQAVRVQISNPDLIGWVGETVTLSPGKVWENRDVRQAIGQSDPKASGADFIWDTIRLQWAPSRRAIVTRQYGKITPARTR